MTEDYKNDPIKELESTTADLMYISETDAPFDVRNLGVIGKIDAKTIAEKFQISPDAQSIETNLDEFFRRLTTEQDWHSDEQRKRVMRFRELHATIERLLKNTRVYRVGTIQIDILIVGESQEGSCIVIHTRSVET